MRPSVPAVLLLAAAFCCCNRDRSRNTVVNGRGKVSDQGPLGDYFPMRAGLKWVYRIKIGETPPLFYRCVGWQFGSFSDQPRAFAFRGSFLALATERGRTEFELALRAKEMTTWRDPIRGSFHRGLELGVVKDDLGVYRDHTRLYWEIAHADEFQATEVLCLLTVLPGINEDPVGQYSSGRRSEGYSARIAFFVGMPGTSKESGMAADTPERLIFQGVEQGRLHLIRECRSEKSGEAGAYVNKAFREDLWFEKRKGLVILEQSVEGRPSMTWTLTSLTPQLLSDTK